MPGIRETLDRLNAAWREHRFDQLGQYFAEDMVMNGPGFAELGRGRAVIVRSYSDFMGKSAIVEYAESNHAIHEWATTGVAIFDWSMTWDQNGKRESATGHDMFVFERRDSVWMAVMRVMLY